MLIEYTIHHLRDPKTGKSTFSKESVLCGDDAAEFKREFERMSGLKLALGYYAVFGITVQVIIEDVE